MFLVIDIGNTRQKAAVFDANCHLLQVIDRPQLSLHDLELLLTYHVRYTMVSNVGKPCKEIEDFLREKTQWIPFTHHTALPIVIKYNTPTTLGLDRIAAVVAAHAQFPTCNVLVVQVGTCLVLDWITSDGNYWGGSISPGRLMRFQALHDYTSQLPLLNETQTDGLWGDSTESSIRQGVIQGMIHEINGEIQRYFKKYGQLQVILTGGDQSFLLNSINFPIFAVSNLVLQGLLKILIFNVEQH